MILEVNNNIELELFSKTSGEEFFRTIHQENISNDHYRANLQRKYASLEAVMSIIEDAIENKFKVDGTPDFFIRYQGHIAGMFEFHPLTGRDFIEVGYWLYPEFRKKGIMTDVFPVMISYARNNFSKSKMLATTSVNNEASLKLLESQNFLRTGLHEEMMDNGTIEKQFVYELALES